VERVGSEVRKAADDFQELWTFSNWEGGCGEAAGHDLSGWQPQCGTISREHLGNVRSQPLLAFTTADFLLPSLLLLGGS
jgi:hypothetical protein